jgi:prepilin-type N-terminal cleavage/methylation domain-containing protein
MMQNSLFTRKNQSGFTIVELMIALSVLSVLLIMSSVLLIQIGRIYSKGVNLANIQNTNRNVVHDIGSALEFGGQQPITGSETYLPAGGDAVTVNSFCLDTTRYSYVVGQQEAISPDYHPSTGAPQTYHVLWEDTMKTNDNCFPMDITKQVPTDPPDGVATQPGSGKELIPLRSRLSVFNIGENPGGSGIYQLEVTIAYGDNDLLNAAGTNCNGGIGQEYCATSTLSTVVTRRLR